MEQAVRGGSVSYQINKEEVCILTCQVKESVFEIPSRIEERPVTELAKKAILGSKLLRELILPDSLMLVGDWAFAHCSNLERVWMPKNKIGFGKGVFKDCFRLTHLFWKEEEDEQVAALLAAVPVKLEAEYLLAPMEAGSSTWLWKLDARLLALLQKPDREGYSRQILCGEEDLMASLDVYLAQRRRQKAELCYLRLLHDRGLGQEERTYLTEWLLAHTKGCESEASWEVVLEEHGTERAYYEVFAKAGCIRDDNFDSLLGDLKEDYPEMKAWLLRYKDAHRPAVDFFDSMSL